MKNLNLKNLLKESDITPIEGEMLKKIKGGGIVAPCSTKLKCGTNTSS
ncbi:hypothetical protein [Flavobacterium psychrophilum]|nr:hypothetical protein [Flavobacterium psychrophilum]QRE24907.1 hypothetical protein H0I46_07470 [Flavobacterium psychrophilum]